MITINDVSLQLHKKTLLKNINLRIAEGEHIALIGQSGSGKSTLAKLLMGLSGGEMQGQITLGEHTIEAGVIDEVSTKALRGRVISMLPQGLADSLNPQLTVIEHVKESLLIHQKTASQQCTQMAKQALIDGNVPEHLHHRHPRMLSGGEIQRVLFVLALLHQPKLLILDEPTAALDAQARHKMVHRLMQLPKTTAVLLITHDLNLAKSFADRIAIIKQGRLVEVGTVNELISTPKQAYTSELLAAITSQQLNTKQQNNDKAKPILHVQELQHTIKDRTLFKHLNFKIHAGEVRIIHGKSGAGKTTLARLLAGRMTPQVGEIHYTKQQKNQPTARHVGVISQHPYNACAPHLSVARIIAEPLQLATKTSPDELANKVNQLLSAVRLPSNKDFLTRRPSELSGGELQRVVIARALALTPSILIADEPTSALDPLIRHSILQLLNELCQQQQIGLIIFTHDPEVSTAFAIKPLTLTAEGLIQHGA